MCSCLPFSWSAWLSSFTWQRSRLGLTALNDQDVRPLIYTELSGPSTPECSEDDSCAMCDQVTNHVPDIQTLYHGLLQELQGEFIDDITNTTDLSQTVTATINMIGIQGLTIGPPQPTQGIVNAPPIQIPQQPATQGATQAAQPVDGTGQTSPPNPQQLPSAEDISSFIEGLKHSGRYFEQIKPPEFNGQREEFEAWSQRFEWFTQTKSNIMSRLLARFVDMPHGLNLQGLGVWVNSVPGAAQDSATKVITAAVELHTYLQQSLQSSGLDRILLPQCCQNGFEVWRLLNERFKPHTATTALKDLRDIVFSPGLFASGKELTQTLLQWEYKMTKFQTQYKMVIPDLLRYLIIMEAAPRDLQSHICLNHSHTTPYQRIRDAVLQYMIAKTAISGVSGSQAMDIDEISYQENPDSAFLAALSPAQKKNVKCFYCGKMGHHKAECRKFKSDLAAGKVRPSGSKGKGKSGKSTSSSSKCSFCGKNHDVSKCWKKYPNLRPSGGKGGKRGVTELTAEDQLSPTEQSDAQRWMGFDVSDVKHGVTHIGINTLSPSPSTVIEIYSVSPDDHNWCMVDSGAGVSVCPPSWCSRFPIIQTAQTFNLTAANGQKMTHHGVRPVTLHADEHTSFQVNFIVTDCTKPILSVSQLQNRGNTVTFTPQSGHISLPGGKKVRLRQGSDTLPYFLPKGVSASRSVTRSRPVTAVSTTSPLFNIPIRAVHFRLDQDDGEESTVQPPPGLSPPSATPFMPVTNQNLDFTGLFTRSVPTAQELFGESEGSSVAQPTPNTSQLFASAILGQGFTASPAVPSVPVIGSLLPSPSQSMPAPGSFMNDTGVNPVSAASKDVWRLTGNVLIRIHHQARQNTFTLEKVKDIPVRVEDLQDVRKWIIYDSTGNISKVKIDNWKTHPSYQYSPLPVKGETRFYLKEVEGSALRSFTDEEIKSHKDMETSQSQELSDLKLPSDPRTSSAGISEDHIDYWTHKGRYWIRHHVRPRNSLYYPSEVQQPGGPDVTILSDIRETRFKYVPSQIGQDLPNTSVRFDNWRQVVHYESALEFTGVTIFRSIGSYPDQLEQFEPSGDQQSAQTLRFPREPSQAEKEKHELTHMPYQPWCRACVEGKGKINRHQTSRSHQPVIQLDFTFPQLTTGGKITILSAIDTETGLCSAAHLPSKHISDYSVAEVKSFLMDAGRLGEIIIQTDQEESIKALVKKMAEGLTNVKIRTSPTYSSGSQGAVERFHQTLQAQIRTLISSVEHKTGYKVTEDSTILPWIVKHSAFLIGRYQVHATDKVTSYFRRWEKEYVTPIVMMCEQVWFRVQQDKKDVNKLKTSWSSGVWLGKCTSSDTHYIGTQNGQVIRCRTIRRRTPSQQWSLSAIDHVKGIPSDPKASGQLDVQFITGGAPPLIVKADVDGQGDQQPPDQPPDPQEVQDPGGEPSPPAGDEMSVDSIPISYLDFTAEFFTPSLTLERTVNGITHTINMAVNEDPSETSIPSDLPPSVADPSEPITEEERNEARAKEYQQIHDFEVKKDVLQSSLSDSQRSNILTSRWVEVRKRNGTVRCRLVVRGFNEQIDNLTDTFAATPTLATLKLLISVAISRGYHIYLGDISVAFLHADVIQEVIVQPPPDYQPDYDVPSGDHVLWSLLKALYGLKTAPKSWQVHINHVLVVIVGFRQSKADPCCYIKGQDFIYLILYVDDLFLMGPDQQVLQDLIAQIKQHVLLRDEGWLTEGSTLSYLGRDLHRQGMQLFMTTPVSPVHDLIEQYGLTKSKPLQTPGTTSIDKDHGSSDISATSDQGVEDHGSDTVDPSDLTSYRSAVGRLQWLTGTRPDIQYSVKELAREVSNLQKSSIIKLKHLLKYLRGTLDYSLVFTQSAIQESAYSELHVYADANWAGCSRTRRSTSGFCIYYLNNLIHSASKTQHSVALSSAESELYGICSAVTEAMHLSNVITEAGLSGDDSVTMYIYSDSQSAIAITLRSGPGKKSKHIQIRYLFVQDMVQSKQVLIRKVHTDDNPADLQTKYLPTDKISKFMAKQCIMQHSGNK